MDTIYSQKKVNYKMINQIKLLIKPSNKIQIITHSFLSLLGGTISYIPYSLPKSDWNYLKGLIKNPNEIIEIVNNTDTFIKRVRFENLNKSLQLIQKLQDIQETQEIQSDELFEVLFTTTKHLQNIAKPLFKNLLQPKRKMNGSSKPNSQQKQIDTSFQSLQRRSQKQNQRPQTKKIENKSLFENKKQQSLRQSTVGSQKSIQTQFSQNNIKVSNRSISQQSNRKVSTNSISRLSTPKSNMSRTSMSSDISFRVLQAQLKKQTRLDKILKLNTKKPKVQSTIKTQIRSNSKAQRKQESPSNSIKMSVNRDRISSTHLRYH